jgi:hypothetical protein
MGWLTDGMKQVESSEVPEYRKDDSLWKMLHHGNQIILSAM